ncbi:hypothetical protein NQ314_008476, partial [Rhamnusium bicolor]
SVSINSYIISNMVFCILFTVTLLPFSHCANILGIVGLPSYSHQVAFRPLWKELSLRGHNVTIITTDPVNDKRLSNLTEIDTKSMYEIVKSLGVAKAVSKEYSMWAWREFAMKISSTVSEQELSNKYVQELIHSKDKHFDVVLVEIFFPEYLAFGRLYNCPTILISSLGIVPYHHYKLGNPFNPILHHDYSAPFYGKLKFNERVLSTLYNFYVLYFDIYKELPLRQSILKKYFPDVKETLNELLDNVDLTFITVNPVIQGVMALGSTTINIAGVRSKTHKDSLSVDLQTYLDDAKDGFIYFSLGTNVQSKELSSSTLNAVIDILKEIPFKILWKFEADDLPGKPVNVKIIKWAPQEQVLSHPNIKLFITQGGLQSMEEAICNHVPLVVIPFFADQERNAKIMLDKGIAKIVYPKSILEKDKLKDSILEVISDPRYKDSIKRLHQLATDEPMTGLERAIWWTEYVIRNKGAKHLRNPAADLPLYQYFLLDVLGFLLLVTIFVTAIIVILTKSFISLTVKLNTVKFKTDCGEQNKKRR